MQDTQPLLLETDFPPIKRPSDHAAGHWATCATLRTHCHVNAGPQRTELMSRKVIDLLLDFIRAHGIGTIDVTGGSPR